MPDICMCKGYNCPLKEKCYRYKAKPCEHGQCYFTDIHYNNDSNDSNDCDYYWEDK